MIESKESITSEQIVSSPSSLSPSSARSPDPNNDSSLIREIDQQKQLDSSPKQQQLLPPNRGRTMSSTSSAIFTRPARSLPLPSPPLTTSSESSSPAYTASSKLSTTITSSATKKRPTRPLPNVKEAMVQKNETNSRIVAGHVSTKIQKFESKSASVVDKGDNDEKARMKAVAMRASKKGLEASTTKGTSSPSPTSSINRPEKQQPPTRRTIGGVGLGSRTLNKAKENVTSDAQADKKGSVDDNASISQQTKRHVGVMKKANAPPNNNSEASSSENGDKSSVKKSTNARINVNVGTKSKVFPPASSLGISNASNVTEKKKTMTATTIRVESDSDKMKKKGKIVTNICIFYITY